MKKFLPILMTIVVFVVCITCASCQQEKPSLTPGDVLPIPTEHPALEGVQVEFVSCDAEGENPNIKVKWANNTDSEITVAKEIRVYRYNNGMPRDLGTAIFEEDVSLKAGEALEVEYSVGFIGLERSAKYLIHANYESSGESHTVEVSFDK